MKSTVTIGIFCCAVLFLGAAYFWRSPRVVQSAPGQKPWNKTSIVSTFTGLKVRELDDAHAAVDYVFDLENRTDTDFQITPGPSAVVMRRLSDGSLSSDANAHLLAAAFVPVGNRTRITIEMSDAFSWPVKDDSAADQSYRDFVSRETSGLKGFVIFDQTSRYEIALPISLSGHSNALAPTLK